MSNFFDRIARANAEKRQQLQSLSDAELADLASGTDEAGLAQAELERRHPIPPKSKSEEVDTPRQATRSFLRLLAVLLLPFVGGTLGCLLASAAVAGWFTPWQTLPSPPETVARIAAIDDVGIWVEGVSGLIYYNARSDRCQSDCWVVIASAPAAQPDTFPRKSRTCEGPGPLVFVKQSMSECRVFPFQDFNTVYALRIDGRVLAWRYVEFGEGPSPAFLFLPCGGVIVALFLATRIVRHDRRERQMAGSA